MLAMRKKKRAVDEQTYLMIGDNFNSIAAEIRIFFASQ
jgi:hypothetical protein